MGLNEQVMAWIRNLVANRLASNGAEWSNVFGHYNSGTYNNQWMIVDYKLFNPKAEALAPGTLWLFEQIPGFTKQYVLLRCAVLCCAVLHMSHMSCGVAWRGAARRVVWM